MHVCNVPKEKAKNVQVNEGIDPLSGAQISGECAGCGDKNPEYVIDDRPLCFDCYKAEKYYWAKGLV